MATNTDARLSVRRALPGMQNVAKTTSSGITAGASVKRMLRVASANTGCVKVEVKNNVLTGKSVGSKDSKDQAWEERLKGFQKHLVESIPAYLVFWREKGSCLLISYSPDDAAIKGKMLLATTRDSLKTTIADIDPDSTIEEFNVTEISDITAEKYNSRHNQPKAYTDFELEKMEVEEQEKEEREARMKKGGFKAPPVALLGLGAAAAAIAKGKEGGRLNIKEAVKGAEANPGPAPKKIDPKLLMPASQKEEEEEEEEDEDEKEEEGEKEEDEKEEEEEEQTKEELETEVKQEMDDLLKQSKEEEEEKEEVKSEVQTETTVTEPVVGEKKLVKKGSQRIKNSFKFFKDAVKKKAAPLKKGGENKFTEEELAEFPDDDGEKTLEELQQIAASKDFGELDKNKLEVYLSTREFVRTFAMDKKEFETAPAWKKKRLKKENKLF